MRQLGFDKILTQLGFNKPQIAAALGNVIGRMTQPASELATHASLQHKTGLGELIGYDYEGMDLQRLYRSADMLLKHRDALESHLFDGALSLFGLTETITLYDLTNTYFEGIAGGIKKAKRGRSKEKRSDCPLVTRAMVLDVSGFPKRSRIYDGNVSEAATLEKMLQGLGAAPGCTVVLEAVFRSLKTDLGLRPVYHQIDRRVEGHLFVSVLAYYLIHTIRLQLKAHGIDGSWEAIRNILSGQVRITNTLQRRDGKTVHVRKTSRPEPAQQNIYTALKLSANPGGTHQTTM